MLGEQVSVSTDLHVLCQTANATIQKFKANRCISRSKRVDFVLVALPQLPLLDLLLRQIPASKPICDRVWMIRHQMAVPTHPSLLHPLAPASQQSAQRLPPRVHVLEAQLVSAPRVRIVLSGRKLPYAPSPSPPLLRIAGAGVAVGAGAGAAAGAGGFAWGALGSESDSEAGSGSSIWSMKRSTWGFTE